VPGDALALGHFLRRPHFGPVVDPADPTPVIDGVRELLWQATARDEDAFVLVGHGQVLGVSMIERKPEPCEQGLDLDWLSAHGLVPEQVCISRMALARDLRGHGIGHALKAAQVVAAGDAGYRAVASLAGMTVGRAIAARAGGWVSSASGAGWVLVPTRCWPGADEPAPT
jgi:GNAT superfamily N-acetyltransferase